MHGEVGLNFDHECIRSTEVAIMVLHNNCALLTKLCAFLISKFSSIIYNYKYSYIYKS